jgi:hypothetical protein
MKEKLCRGALAYIYSGTLFGGGIMGSVFAELLCHHSVSLIFFVPLSRERAMARAAAAAANTMMLLFSSINMRATGFAFGVGLGVGIKERRAARARR